MFGTKIKLEGCWVKKKFSECSTLQLHLKWDMYESTLWDHPRKSARCCSTKWSPYWLSGNSHPLTEVHVSSNVYDLQALTLKHFITGRGTLNLLPAVFVDEEIASHKFWHQAQVVASSFGVGRCNLHCSLINYKKWLRLTSNVKIEDLLLVVIEQFQKVTGLLIES